MKKIPSPTPCGFIQLRALLALLLCVAGVALGFLAFSPASAQQQGPPADADLPRGTYRGLAPVVHFDISPPLRELATREPTVQEPGGERKDMPKIDSDRPLGLQDVDQLVQREVGSGEIPSPLASFDAFDGNGWVPSDSVAAVGPGHVVVMANTRYAVYTKTGTALVGPATINTLWSGFGGACQNENAGDPIVLYDRRADRWILTQFTTAGPTYYNCMAISQTSDPTGSYYRYAINAGTDLPDYPKYSTWGNAYLISTTDFRDNSFVSISVYALNRGQMLAGNPSPSILSYFVTRGSMPYRIGHGLLPADVDSWTQPPTPNTAYFIGTQDNGSSLGAPSDAINLWRFTFDFTTPGNSSFTLTNTLTVASYDSIFPCSPDSRDCIPQSGTTQKLDHIGNYQRPMFRAAYRNFGTHESIVINQSVEVSGISGIRWWEIRNVSSTPSVFQQGTYAPGVTDSIHRWMGSIAMDGLGNIALGYSVSNGSMFPSIRYTGRYASSTPGTMPLGEGVLANGARSQTTSARWGDYTAMVVDPTDDLTFWYVNQYYPTSTSSTWRLRVGSFRLANLAAGAANLVAENCQPPNNAVDPGETVTMSFCVRNTGQTSTGNVTGTLLAGGGVSNPGGTQLYGVIAPGATACRNIAFTASGACDGALTATVRFEAGSEELGRLSYPITLGSAPILSQNFDAVSAPAIPSGWSATQGTNPGGNPAWVTSSSVIFPPTHDSFPNSAYTPDPLSVLDNRLTSPSFSYPVGARLKFSHSYLLAQQSATTANSAAVLEISVNGGAYTDIIAAGGSFVTGGYSHTGINTSSANPLLPSRPNWSGNSDGFVTTIVLLPNAGAGQPVRVRWRMGSGNTLVFGGNRGWRIDDVEVSSYGCCGNAPPIAAAVSRKSHAGAGVFNVALPVTGTPGVEPRSGGTTSDHAILAIFGGTVLVTGTPQAQVLVGNGTPGSGGLSNGGAVSVSGNIVTIPLTNVTDAQTLTLRLNSVNGTGDVLIPMSVLLGDTTGNGSVTASDVAQSKSQSGQAVTTSNFRTDVNASGAINATDIGLVKSSSGRSLP